MTAEVVRPQAIYFLLIPLRNLYGNAHKDTECAFPYIEVHILAITARVPVDTRIGLPRVTRLLSVGVKDHLQTTGQAKTLLLRKLLQIAHLPLYGRQLRRFLHANCGPVRSSPFKS
jgi:hypothetical protein